ncbi:MAG: ArsA family ATPase [Spirochaetota bacterium]|nr:ArsA family ATPase [Spirochaetota bacterium]
MKTDLSFILQRKIIFLGGKGGVGKTTCASGLSVLASEKGLKTLLISTDPAHSSSDIFEKNLSGGGIVKITKNLDSIEIDSEKEVEKYIDEVKANIRKLASPLMLEDINKQIELAKLSPGAEESALFYKFTELILTQKQNYDIIIFDTAPTGHSLRLLSLPELMTGWIDGMIKRRKKVNILKKMWENVSNKETNDDNVMEILEKRKYQVINARNLLVKKDFTSFIFVMIPEKLAISETERAVNLLEKYKIPVEGIIINKVLPNTDTGSFFESRKRQEDHYIKEIQSIFSKKPLWCIPFAINDIRGYASLKEFTNFFI